MAIFFQHSRHGLELESNVVVPLRADPGAEVAGSWRASHCTRVLYLWMLLVGLIGLVLLVMASWMIGLGVFIVLATLCFIASEIGIPDFMLGEKYELEDSEWLKLPQAAKVGFNRPPNT